MARNGGPGTAGFGTPHKVDVKDADVSVELCRIYECAVQLAATRLVRLECGRGRGCSWRLRLLALLQPVRQRVGPSIQHLAFGALLQQPLANFGGLNLARIDHHHVVLDERQRALRTSGTAARACACLVACGGGHLAQSPLGKHTAARLEEDKPAPWHIAPRRHTTHRYVPFIGRPVTGHTNLAALSPAVLDGVRFSCFTSCAVSVPTTPRHACLEPADVPDQRQLRGRHQVAVQQELQQRLLVEQPAGGEHVAWRRGRAGRPGPPPQARSAPLRSASRTSTPPPARRADFAAGMRGRENMGFQLNHFIFMHQAACPRLTNFALQI